MLDHLVMPSCRHAHDDCSLIIGNCLGPAPKAKDSGLVSNHLFALQLRNTKPLQFQTALGYSDYWTSSLEMTVLGHLVLSFKETTSPSRIFQVETSGQSHSLQNNEHTTLKNELQ